MKKELIHYVDGLEKYQNILNRIRHNPQGCNEYGTRHFIDNQIRQALNRTPLEFVVIHAVYTTDSQGNTIRAVFEREFFKKGS